MGLRDIIRIDEDKCNGCGLCVSACAEGAIQIVDGKARLVKEQYCDGLGACLGECPQEAIMIEKREADDFDPVAVEQHLKGMGIKHEEQKKLQLPVHGGCPGSALRSFKPFMREESEKGDQATSINSRLTNWPVQLKLLPVDAPYLKGADLLIAADCAPFAYADFHRLFIEGKVLVIACPKLDDVDFYRKKLTAMFSLNNLNSISIAYMEVPCCFGLVHVVRQAMTAAVIDIPFTLTKIGIRGEIVETSQEAGKPVSK